MRRDVFWSAAEAVGSALFSVAAAFIIARLIGPSELGIGATAAAVHVLLWVTVNALFADAIVQRDSVDDIILSSGAWASTAVGCVAAAVQAGSGWLLAWMLDDTRLIQMALLLAVPFPFIGLGGALQGLLTRQRRYQALAARTLIGQGAGMVLGIALAAHQAGAWALVFQQATGSLLAALVLISVAGWRPSPVWRWSAVISLLWIGVPLTASTLLQIGRYRIFAILIGGTAGATAMGQVHVAFRLVDTIRDITFTAMWRLLLPILSEHQHDMPALRRQVDRLLRLSSAVTMPLCGGLAITLLPVTTLVLGPAWGEAGVAAVPLVALMALQALMFASGAALIAVGKARYTLYANSAALVATIVFVLGWRPATPWEAVLLWCGAQLLITPYAMWVNARALGVSLSRPLWAGVPMLLISAVGVAAAIELGSGGPLETLVRRAVVFMIIVTACAAPLVWLPRTNSRRPRSESGLDESRRADVHGVGGVPGQERAGSIAARIERSSLSLRL